MLSIAWTASLKSSSSISSFDCESSRAFIMMTRLFSSFACDFTQTCIGSGVLSSDSSVSSLVHLWWMLPDGIFLWSKCSSTCKAHFYCLQLVLKSCSAFDDSVLSCISIFFTFMLVCRACQHCHIDHSCS